MQKRVTTDAIHRELLPPQAGRQELAEVFRVSPAAMALWRGRELVFDMVNPEFEALFPGRSLLGRTLLEALPEIADQAFPEMLRRVRETGESQVGHETLARLSPRPGEPPEDRYFDFKYARLDGVAGEATAVYCHAIDVTQRVVARRREEQTRDELRLAVEALERERELRERFVATLSHDLLSPLGVVHLGVERLLRAEPGDAQVRQVLGARIRRNVQRIDGMLQDLLDAHTLDAGGALALQPEPCDLRALAAATLEDLAGVYGDRFVLEAPAALPIQGDARYLRRVLENLSSNAVKYGAERTPVTVRLAREGTDALLSVHNHGAAIPAADQARILDARPRGQPHARGALGWGLGLLLVRGVVDAHGGSVSLCSAAAAGTTFTVRLPAQGRA